MSRKKFKKSKNNLLKVDAPDYCIRMQQARMDLGFSKAVYLARAMGINKQTYAAYEKHRMPTIDFLENLSKKYPGKVDILWIQTGQNSTKIMAGIGFGATAEAEVIKPGYPDSVESPQGSYSAPAPAPGSSIPGLTRIRGGPNQKMFDISLHNLIKIFESQNIEIIEAIKANLMAFAGSIDKDNDIKGLNKKVDDLDSEVRQLKKQLESNTGNPMTLDVKY